MTAQSVLDQVQKNIEAAKAGEETVEIEETKQELIDVPVDEEEPEEVEESEEDEEEGEEEVQEAFTNGYKPYDEYIAEGNDPDMYRGPKAFVQFKEMQDKLKGQTNEVKSENSKLQSQMDEMMDMFLEDKRKSVANQKKSIEAALKEAHENMDTKRVAELTAESMEISDAPEPAPAKEEESGYQGSVAPIQNLINQNPIIDHTSDKFDADAAQMLGSRIDRRASQEPNMSEDRLQAIIEQEWKATQEKLGLVKKRKVKVAPKTPGAQTPTKRSTKKVAKMEPNEKKMYDMFVKSGRTKAAEQYLNTIAERS